MSFLKASNRPRLFVVLATLVVSFALALTLAPAAQAAPVLPPAKPAISVPTPRITHAMRVQASIATRVMHAGSRRTLDYRKAKRTAGRTHQVIARDFALGMLYEGGKVTHRSAADNRVLRARAKQLGLGLGWLLHIAAVRPDAGNPCPGINKIQKEWYGYLVRLDHCNTQEIVKGAATVAFVGGAIGTIFTLDARSKTIFGVSLLVVGAGAFALGVCDNPGRGVRLYSYGPTGYGLGVWCRSQ